MDNSTFEQLFQSLKAGTESLAKTSLQDYVGHAKKDGVAALDTMKADLQRWAEEVETGALTKDDLSFLLMEDASLGEMRSLKEAGLAEVQVDKFRNGMISLITGTLTSLIRV